MSPDDPRHGRLAGYLAHLSDGESACEPCTRANARYHKGLILDHLQGRRRSVSSMGAMRRLQALQALGWSMERCYREFGGPHEQHLRRIAAGRVPTIRRRTHAAVCDLFERLAMRLPDPCSAVSKLRNEARRRGYVPPLAWDDIDHDARPANTWEEPRGHYELDHAVVWRVLDGQVVDTTYAERLEIMRQWLARGGSERDLARRMGWKEGRYVTREDVA